MKPRPVFASPFTPALALRVGGRPTLELTFFLEIADKMMRGAALDCPYPTRARPVLSASASSARSRPLGLR